MARRGDGDGRRPRRRGLFARLLAGVIGTLALAAALYFFGPKLLAGVFSSRTQVTNVTVEQRLEAIGELATYAMKYSGYTERSNTRSVLGIKVPGTRNAVKIAYSGTIKVGYTVEDIRVEVDNEARVIRVTLPAPIVVSNAIDEDSLQYVEVNNILNPIPGDAAAGYLEEIRGDELAKAEEMGIYDKARENAEKVIRDTLGGIEGYTIEFQ